MFASVYMFCHVFAVFPKALFLIMGMIAVNHMRRDKAMYYSGECSDPDDAGQEQPDQQVRGRSWRVTGVLQVDL
jgi:hypothetical protein